MRPPAPELTVVVPCTRPARVEECLRALSTEPDAHRIEVFVVGELPRAAPSARPFSLHLIPLADRHANARRRRGLGAGVAPRVAFLDDDAVPEPGWLGAALELPIADLVVRTGPELPFREGARARLVHAVSASPVGEVGSGHHHHRSRAIAWYRVPFCNFVASRRVFEVVGEPSVTLPWDVGDFEVCLRARGLVAFEADPRLRVRHDRYPDDVGAYLAALAGRRVATGDKLVTYPRIYGRIPPVLGCALFPWLALAAPALAPLGLGAYVGVLASQVPRALRHGGLAAVPPFLGLLAATHAVTVVSVQVGIARGLLRSAGLVADTVEDEPWRASC